MHIMVAYDHSRNAQIALEGTIKLFGSLKPEVTLINVIEDPGSATASSDDMFSEQYKEQKEGAEAAARQLSEAGMPTRVLLAQGDARKMILRATQERKPDLLVIARHSNKPDSGFLARSIDAIVDEFEHMTFGAVSSFLARRVQCALLILPAP